MINLNESRIDHVGDFGLDVRASKWDDTYPGSHSVSIGVMAIFFL